MLALTAVLVIFLGAALGSFANVLVVRLKEGTSIRGRSRCPDCRETIQPRHLIPVVSWFMLRMRCAMCGKRIHWQYPAVETAGAVLALIAFFRFSTALAPAAGGQFLFELALSFVLIVIVAFDLRWQLVPLEFTAAGAIVVGAGRVLLGNGWLDPALGAIIVSAALGLLVAVSRGAWMGAGDPVVGLLMGAALGFPLAAAGLFLAFIIGGAVAAALLLQGAVTRKTPVPFAPFLAAGTLVALWWRDPILMFVRYAFA